MTPDPIWDPEYRPFPSLWARLIAAAVIVVGLALGLCGWLWAVTAP